MFIKIDYHSGLPVYKQIMNQVKYMISTDELKPEEKIPSVRELAEMLKINPTSVARAFHDLEHEGAIYTRRGSGTYISARANRLEKSEKIRILNQTIQNLLAQAHQMGIDRDEVSSLFKENAKRMVNKGAAE